LLGAIIVIRIIVFAIVVIAVVGIDAGTVSRLSVVGCDGNATCRTSCGDEGERTTFAGAGNVLKTRQK